MRRFVCFLVLSSATFILASDTCSGNGITYIEEESLGIPVVCSCFQCYEGPHCENLIPNCALETRVAEATLWTPWHEEHKAELGVNISGTYHLGYLLSPREIPPYKPPSDSTAGYEVPTQWDTITRLLNVSIRALHEKMGHDVSQHTLVLGSGGVQLIDSALYALTQGPNKRKRMSVTAQVPYYPHFHQESETNPLTDWTDSAADIDPSSLIEIVTAPNNPDGRQLTAMHPEANLITDLVYNWPHYSAADGIRPTANDSLQIWSLSKLAGLAASRVGWAFVKDEEVAATMNKFIFLASTAPSVESQLRAVKILRALVDKVGKPDDFFKFARSALDSRWGELTDILSMSSRLSLEGGVGTLFMWIKCQDPEDAKDCAGAFAKAGIMADSGVNYGSDVAHVRVCMGHHESTYELLKQRLRGMSPTPPLSAKDKRRAVRTVPGPDFAGPDAAAIAATLNGHLTKFADKHHLKLVPCADTDLASLHDVQRRLFTARAPELQPIYDAVEDPRATAFAPSASATSSDSAQRTDMESRLAHEALVASASVEAGEVVRDAACHRTVMQLVHHLSEQARAAVVDVALPMLPIKPHHAINQPSTSRAIDQARDVYANATTCITCHSNSGGSNTTTPSHPPVSPAPYVPLWPPMFSVPFGLSTANMTNVSSRVDFDVNLPAMHVHHDRCPPHFFPKMPEGADGVPCDLQFHGDGLHMVWHPTPDATKCCKLIESNMTLNLGLKELGGFEFTGNTTATDLWGNEIPVERWESGQTLAPPAGFQIFIDEKTGLDVHYHNGGPYFLEWALGKWDIGPTPTERFALPKDAGCQNWCQREGASLAELHPSHAHIWRRAMQM